MAYPSAPSMPGLAAPSGCCPLRLRLTYSGYNAATHATYVNRTTPFAPNAGVNSVSIACASTTVIWDFPVGSGIIDSFQSAQIRMYGDINGGGGYLNQESQSFKAGLINLGGGNYSISVGSPLYPSHPIKMHSFGYASSCPIGGTVSANARPLALSDVGTESCVLTGGTFTLVTY